MDEVRIPQLLYLLDVDLVGCLEIAHTIFIQITYPAILNFTFMKQT